MIITVNGTEMEYDTGLTGGSLLTALQIPAATVVAEINGRIVRRENFPTYVLADGDRVELVTVVGGG